MEFMRLPPCATFPAQILSPRKNNNNSTNLFSDSRERSVCYFYIINVVAVNAPIQALSLLKIDKMILWWFSLVTWLVSLRSRADPLSEICAAIVGGGVKCFSSFVRENWVHTPSVRTKRIALSLSRRWRQLIKVHRNLFDFSVVVSLLVSRCLWASIPTRKSESETKARSRVWDSTQQSLAALSETITNLKRANCD